MLGVARRTTVPQLVQFGEDYANTVGQTWNGRDIDRWFNVDAGFDRVTYHNMTSGIVALHRGIKP